MYKKIIISLLFISPCYGMAKEASKHSKHKIYTVSPQKKTELLQKLDHLTQQSFKEIEKKIELLSQEERDELLQTLHSSYRLLRPAVWFSLGQIHTATLSNDASLALISANNDCYLADLRSWTSRTRALSGHTAPVIAVDLSADKNYALTGSADGTARFWNLTTQPFCCQVLEHNQNVSRVRFIPENPKCFLTETTQKIVTEFGQPKEYIYVLRLWDLTKEPLKCTILFNGPLSKPLTEEALQIARLYNCEFFLMNWAKSHLKKTTPDGSLIIKAKPLSDSSLQFERSLLDPLHYNPSAEWQIVLSDRSRQPITGDILEGSNRNEANDTIIAFDVYADGDIALTISRKHNAVKAHVWDIMKTQKTVSLSDLLLLLKLYKHPAALIKDEPARQHLKALAGIFKSSHPTDAHYLLSFLTTTMHQPDKDCLICSDSYNSADKVCLQLPCCGAFICKTCFTNSVIKRVEYTSAVIDGQPLNDPLQRKCPFCSKTRKNMTENSTEQLFEAAAHNNVALLRSLKLLGVYVDRQNSFGQTPLFVAAASNHVETVRCLLGELGAEPNIDLKPSCVPLLIAAQRGNFQAVSCLKEMGVDMNICSTYDCRRAVHEAAKLNNAEMLRLLVQLGAKLMIQDRYGRTPLSMALKASRTNLIRCLIELGLPIDNVLWHAARLNKPELIQYLATLDDKLVRTHGASAMRTAAMANSLKAMERLHQLGVDPNIPVPGTFITPIYGASEANRPEAITLLKKLGANLDARSKYETALDGACRVKAFRAIEALIQAGAKIEVQEDLQDKNSPLLDLFDALTKNADADSAKLLTEPAAATASSAQPNPIAASMKSDRAAYEKGLRVLFLCALSLAEQGIKGTNHALLSYIKKLAHASHNTNKSMRQMLSIVFLALGDPYDGDLGALVSALEVSTMRNVILLAVVRGSTLGTQAEWLKDHINIKDNILGMTPIMWAAACGNVEFAQELMNFNPDFLLTDDYGNTALHYAIRNGHVALVKLLKNKAPVAYTIKNNFDRTPVDIAISSKQSGEMLLALAE